MPKNGQIIEERYEEKTDAKILLTIQQVADLMEVTRPAVEKWGLLPVERGGPRRKALYDLRDVIRYFKARVKMRGAGQVDEDSGETINLTLENARIAKHKARLLQIEVEEAEENVVAASEVLSGYQDMLTTIRAGFVNLPTKLAKRLEHSEALFIRDELRNEIDSILSELVEQIESGSTNLKQKKRK